MHEYLASGQPVVSAPICSVEEFAHVLGIANSPENWSKHRTRPIRQRKFACSTGSTPESSSSHDWEVLVDKIACTISQRSVCSPTAAGVNVEVGS